ncbi:MAG TPA: HAD family hydrolase [Tepidisphaeraceae bacterium]|nr:HAD family hydrolase [Tepidisphaeraceae bacterium]
MNMVRVVRLDMKQCKMIAIDMDGTLLCPRSTVTPRVKAAIHAAVRSGLLVVFATGRNINECKAVLAAVDHYDSGVFVGGAVVIDTRNWKTMHRTMMQPDLTRKLTALLESMGHAVLAVQDHSAGGYDYLITGNIPVNSETAHWMRVNSASHLLVEKLSEHAHEHTIRVGIVAPPEEVARVKAAVEKQFGQRVVLLNLAVPSAGVEVLEVFDPAVNKWEGIQHIARQHGILGQEIIAIGDDVNDIPMLKNAGWGIAMGNAKPEVQKAARRVIGSNQDEGLAAFLEEIVALRTGKLSNTKEGEVAA